MNLRLGPRPRHYGVCLLSAVFGLTISLRQTLLHINPYFDTKAGQPTLDPEANRPFGQAVFGLDLYVWGVIIFMVSALATGVMLLFRRQFEQDTHEPQWLRRLAIVGVTILFVVACLEALTTFAECGFGNCPNDASWNWWLFS